ncbi:hypothetical protein [Leptospira jelokensis]|uniref:Putative phage tail fibre C-terminal domain-containing protein n=1 Tax=Leptospira jelokensis TaxID=2484931 RepID=A0A4Z1A295_9LEPT|nr:hypothetical protein [Leptospira jelokensis]TGL58629.1 hypothetical protein EHQ62_17190 [Leptospira jelokensis]
MKKLYYYLIAGISNIVQLGRRGNTLRSEPTHIEFRSPTNSLLRVKVGNAVELTDAVSLNDLREKVLLNYGTPVQNISQLTAIPNAERRDKQIRYVEDLRSYYQFDAESNESVPNVDDPNRVFLPNDLSSINTGRWIQTRGRTEYHSDLLGIDEGDDHPQYQLRNERNNENGYPGLTSNREIEVLSGNLISGIVTSFLRSIANVARTWNLPDANGTLTTEERLASEVTTINDVLSNKENSLPSGTSGQFLNGLKAMVAVAWNFIEGKPNAFPPITHGHLISEVMDLEDTLSAKADLVDGKVPASQVPIFDPALQIVEDIDERNSISPTGNLPVYVKDASDDPSVTTGGAFYLFELASETWIKLSEMESMEIVQSWANILDKPTTFPPSAHGHNIADVSGLQTALDGKRAVGNIPGNEITQDASHRFVTDAEKTLWNNTAHNAGDISGSVSFSGFNANRIYKARLIGNATFTTISGGVTDQVYVMKFLQDGTGGRTITLPSNVKIPTGETPDTAANRISILTMYFDGTNYLGSWKKGWI